MLIAQYKGKSWVSRAIRFLTRGPYSHSAFVFDEAAEEAHNRLVQGGYQFARLREHVYEGAVVEAWLPCVRNVESISDQHTPGTAVDLYEFFPALTPDQEEQLLMILDGQIGMPYAVRDVLRFVTRRPPGDTGRIFCSELVFLDSEEIGALLLAETQAGEVPPSWIQRSRRLRRKESVVTTVQTIGP